MIVPDQNSDVSKRKQVESMFDSISHKYDFLNRIISFGIDKHWRKKAILCLKDYKPQCILDIATGTGDFAILANKLLNPNQIIGVDISEKMIAFGQAKLNKLSPRPNIELQSGDSENLIFDDAAFDAAIVAFGVRNFENLQASMNEISRTIKNGGALVVLEFGIPKNPVSRFFYRLYFHGFLPIIGGLVSGNKKAYSYLPRSVEGFPYGEKFIEILKKAGFQNVTIKYLTMGIANIYFAQK